MNQYFGTDGIRGRVGEKPMLPDFFVKLGWAMGTLLARQGGSRIIMGKDTRMTGYMFEAALQAGLTSAGIDVYLTGPMPTPAIAYLTKSMHFDAGLIITASHNPYQDNGVKFFSADGMKMSDQFEIEIEEKLKESIVLANPEKIGRVYRVEDAIDRYIKHAQSMFPSNLDLSGLKIIIDCANGATYYLAPRIFSRLEAEVIAIGDQPDGININQYCGSTHPEVLQAKVLSEKADLGIAFDGDGDRLIMVDHLGEIVDGDELLFIMVDAALRLGEPIHGVVGTFMTNLGLEKAMIERDIAFKRVRVGDRYVIEALKKEGWQMGGESSGHLIYLKYGTTGDGMMAALLVLAAMVLSKVSLNQIKQGMKKYPQSIINVPVAERIDPMTVEKIASAVRKTEKTLGTRGRVLLRASGTESLIRVMVEGDDRHMVSTCADELAQVVSTAMGA